VSVRPGNRVVRTATTEVQHGGPCVENGTPGIAKKSAQVDGGVPNAANAAAARTIAEGEEFVIIRSGIVPVPLDALPEEANAGDPLFIDPATNALTLAATPGAVNEAQAVTVEDATDGTFTLEFDGEVTADIDHDAVIAAVEAALEALPNLEAADVAVTGTAGNYIVTFSGAFAGENVPVLVADGTDLIGAGADVTVDTTAEGAPAGGVKFGRIESMEDPSSADHALVNLNDRDTF
jgi:hypothetical protein